MSEEHNRRIAQQLLAGIGAGTDTDDIAALFSLDVQFEIQAHLGALPWIGRKTRRSAAADFIRDTRCLIEQLHFDVQDILTSDGRAVIVGELSTRINATGVSSSQPLRSS